MTRQLAVDERSDAGCPPRPRSGRRSWALGGLVGFCLLIGAMGCAHTPIGAVGGKVTSAYSGKGLAVVRPASDESVAPLTYVVQKGDTLWSLSRRFNTSVTRLMEANSLKRPEDLRIDHRLLIPVDPNKDGREAVRPATKPPPNSTTGMPVASEASAPTASLSSRPTTTRPAASMPTRSSSRRYPLVWPAQGEITSRFGQRGSHQHDGIDISAKKGAPVRTAAGGEVIYAANQGGYGNLVLVRHADGMVTVYAHLDRLTVRKGQRLLVGQSIGTVGQTGRASGPHLHFEVRRGISPENPLKLLPP